MLQKVKMNLAMSIIGCSAILVLIGPSQVVAETGYTPPPMAFDAQENISAALPGIWNSSYRYNATGGTVSVKGKTQYMPNGRYYFLGQMTVSLESTGNPVDILFNVDGMGEWKVTGTTLTAKILDLQSHPLTMTKSNGERVDLQNLEQVSGLKLPRIESMIPPGTTQQYDIVSFNNDHMRLRTNDPFGHGFDFDVSKEQTAN